jgi:hypothetical protein
MVVIYYANRAATSDDIGYTFKNQRENHFKTNFFVFGILTRDDKYTMLNHVYLTSQSEIVGDYSQEYTTGFRENRWAIQ